MASTVIDKIGPYSIKKLTSFDPRDMTRPATISYAVFWTEGNDYIIEFPTLARAKEVCTARAKVHNKAA